VSWNPSNSQVIGYNVYRGGQSGRLLHTAELGGGCQHYLYRQQRPRWAALFLRRDGRGGERQGKHLLEPSTGGYSDPVNRIRISLSPLRPKCARDFAKRQNTIPDRRSESGPLRSPVLDELHRMKGSSRRLTPAAYGVLLPFDSPYSTRAQADNRSRQTRHRYASKRLRNSLRRAVFELIRSRLVQCPLRCWSRLSEWWQSGGVDLSRNAFAPLSAAPWCTTHHRSPGTRTKVSDATALRGLTWGVTHR